MSADVLPFRTREDRLLFAAAHEPRACEAFNGERSHFGLRKPGEPIDPARLEFLLYGLKRILDTNAEQAATLRAAQGIEDLADMVLAARLAIHESAARKPRRSMRRLAQMEDMLRGISAQFEAPYTEEA